MKLQSSIQLALSAALLLLPTLVGLSCEAKVSEAETILIRHIAKDGMLEVSLGKIAEERASSNRVKDFAKHMITDHSKANEELKEAAQKDAVELPTHLNAKQKEKEDALKALSGEAFDTKYMAEMVAAHKKAVEALTKESTTGTGNLKAWAEKTLPTIKEHSQEAKSVESKIANTGTEK